MFERYTEQARRALFFARYETSQVGGVSIEAEHLLLGLTRERGGLTNRIFEQFHLSPESLRNELESLNVTREKVSTSVEIPFSAETKRILQHATDEADLLGHRHIGTEHLLLGILREEHSATATVLIRKGLNARAARDALIRILNEQPSSESKVNPAAFQATNSAVRMTVHHRLFASAGKSWEALSAEASAFATEVGRERLINISVVALSEPDVFGVGAPGAIVVWYWE